MFALDHSLSLSLKLAEEGNSLTDLLVELREVIEVCLDLFDGKVNEHAGDLGSSLLTDELLDKLVDELADEDLVVGVLGDDGGEVAVSSLVVVGNHRVWVGKRSLGHALDVGGNDDDLLSGGLAEDGLLRDILKLRLHGVAALSGGSVVLLLLLLSSVLVVRVGAVLSGTVAVVLVAAAVGTAVVVVIVLGSVAVVVVVLLERHAAAKLLLEENEDLLDELYGVRLLEEAGIDGVGSELFPLVVEVGLVLGLGLLLLADLGELVVGHVELLTLEDLLVELGAGEGGAVGLLEADERAARWLTFVGGQDLHTLDFTVVAEELSQVLVGELGGEVLHEEVALLLGVLEALLLSPDHSLSLDAGQSWLNIETVRVRVVEFLDSSISSLESVILVLGVVEADEGELALDVVDVILHHDGMDIAELAENLSELGLIP